MFFNVNPDGPTAQRQLTMVQNEVLSSDKKLPRN